MKRNQLKSPVTEPAVSEDEFDAANEDIEDTELQTFDNSDDFYELISELDPDAADDNFYETDPEFIEQRSWLRRELIQNFWIAAVMLVVFIGAAYLIR